MRLWQAWWQLVRELRPACARRRTFWWLVTCLAAFCTRRDLAGVTSFVRGLGLRAAAYDRLLDFFHSPAISLAVLTRCWVALALRQVPGSVRVNGRIVLLGDGLKAPKSGRKMPGVKRLHQESENNNKPEWIRGHSCQALALVVATGHGHFALPLAARIHEGVVAGPGDRRTLMDKLLELLPVAALQNPAYVVLDAYYGCQTIARGLRQQNHHLICRLRKNATARPLLSPRPAGQRPPGRPRVYGPKRRLLDFLTLGPHAATLPSPYLNEPTLRLHYAVADLYWAPAKAVVRFVVSRHPTRGTLLLMTTDLSLDPATIIRLYAYRSKIEVSFKQALHTVGAWAYHFWLRTMTPRPRTAGNQYRHRQSPAARQAVARKLAAYHLHLQLGLIAQGLRQCLAVRHPQLVWRHFGSWLRTARTHLAPSEAVTAAALRHHLPDLLAGTAADPAYVKFLQSQLDPQRAADLRLAA